MNKVAGFSDLGRYTFGGIYCTDPNLIKFSGSPFEDFADIVYTTLKSLKGLVNSASKELLRYYRKSFSINYKVILDPYFPIVSGTTLLQINKSPSISMMAEGPHIENMVNKSYLLNKLRSFCDFCTMGNNCHIEASFRSANKGSVSYELTLPMDMYRLYGSHILPLVTEGKLNTPLELKHTMVNSMTPSFPLCLMNIHVHDLYKIIHSVNIILPSLLETVIASFKKPPTEEDGIF